MNDTEIGRIAAALNQARPDWPVKQLRTLLNDQRITSRPRRDVFVALAWIASEPNTSNPYRVLEAGPWWRAAAVDGTTTNRDRPTAAERCSTCSQARERCRQLFADDHDFAPDFRPQEPAVDVAATIAGLRDLAANDRPHDQERP